MYCILLYILQTTKAFSCTGCTVSNSTKAYFKYMLREDTQQWEKEDEELGETLSGELGLQKFFEDGEEEGAPLLW